MTIILGPCPCTACRLPLTWDGVQWNDPEGKHRCEPTSPVSLTCNVQRCTSAPYAKGRCRKHYRRWQWMKVA